jgi:heterodisulfide reductase subunit D
MILAAREGLSGQGLMPPALQTFGEAVGENRNISGEGNDGRLIWAENLEGGLAVAEGASAEVLYFVGCLGSFFPSSYRVPQAFVRILGAAGVTYDLLGEEEWCCGYPLLMVGMLDRAREQIEHNVEAVRKRDVSTVVMSCPSCYHAWKHLYPQALGEEVGVEVLHATEFLDSLVERGRLSLGELAMRVTYHDPCDLGRKGGIVEAPRRILKAIPGLELVEMADHGDSSLCCGGGSNLETYDADLMRQVSSQRLEQALDTGAEAIITACTQCERTLTAAARKKRARIRVMDITELVWKAVQAAREAEMA